MMIRTKNATEEQVGLLVCPLMTHSEHVVPPDF